MSCNMEHYCQLSLMCQIQLEMAMYFTIENHISDALHQIDFNVISHRKTFKYIHNPKGLHTIGPGFPKLPGVPRFP